MENRIIGYQKDYNRRSEAGSSSLDGHYRLLGHVVKQAVEDFQNFRPGAKIHESAKDYLFHRDGFEGIVMEYCLNVDLDAIREHAIRGIRWA